MTTTPQEPAEGLPGADPDEHASAPPSDDPGSQEDPGDE
jgi:hypothetical protein